MANDTASLNILFKEAYGPALESLLSMYQTAYTYERTSHCEATDILFRWHGIKFTQKRKEKMTKAYYNKK